jgi:hypothetical protein
MPIQMRLWHERASSHHLLQAAEAFVRPQKLAATGIIGVGVAIASSLLTLAIALPWLSAQGVDLAPRGRHRDRAPRRAPRDRAQRGRGRPLGALAPTQTVAVTVALVRMMALESLLVSFKQK